MGDSAVSIWVDPGKTATTTANQYPMLLLLHGIGALRVTSWHGWKQQIFRIFVYNFYSLFYIYKAVSQMP